MTVGPRNKLREIFPEFLKVLKIRKLKYTPVYTSTSFVKPFLERMSRETIKISRRNKYMCVLNHFGRPVIGIPPRKEVHSLLWNLFHEKAHISDRRKNINMPLEAKEFFAEFRALHSVLRKFGRASYPFIHYRIFSEEKNSIHDFGLLKSMRLIMSGSNPEKIYRKIANNLRDEEVFIFKGGIRIKKGEKDVTEDFLKKAGLSDGEIRILMAPEE